MVDSHEAVDFVGIFADIDDEDDAREAEFRDGSAHLSGNVSISGGEDITFAVGATTYATP